MSKRVQNMQKIVELLLAQNNEFDTNAAKTVQNCLIAIENDDIESDAIKTFIGFAYIRELGDRFIDVPNPNSSDTWIDLVYAAKEDARQEYLRILSQTKQKIVKETGYKTANKDIHILYQDAFCKCSDNTLTNEIIFTTTITGEELIYNLSGHYYGPHMFFNCIDESKSFDIYGEIWFPNGGLSAPNNEWKRFCYFAMADVINNKIKNQRLYELPESLYLYIEAVNIMFEETFFIGHNRVNSGILPPAGGLAVNEYALNRQGEKIEEWNDYKENNNRITESILYKISKMI